MAHIADDFERLANQGHYHRERGEYSAAIAQYEKAITKLTSLVQVCISDDTSGVKTALLNASFPLARIYYFLANCYREQSKYGKAHVYLTKAQVCLDKFVQVRNSIETSGMALSPEQLEECKQFRESETFARGIVMLQKQSGSSDLSTDTDPVFQSIQSLPTSFFKLYEEKSNSSTNTSCFIATAAYSTSYHPDLDTFRRFRDDKLLTNFPGRLLVHFYYWIGPRCACWLEERSTAKLFVRVQLERLATWMRYHL